MRINNIKDIYLHENDNNEEIYMQIPHENSNYEEEVYEIYCIEMNIQLYITDKYLYYIKEGRMYI